MPRDPRPARLGRALESVARVAFAARGPGGVVAIGRGGRTLWSHARGYADCERRVPWSATTRSRAYSITKWLVGLGALELARRDRLRLDDRVGVHLPTWRGPIATTPVRRLLDNTAGLRDYEAALWITGHGDRASVDLEQQVALLAADWPRDLPCGAGRWYVNTGFRVADELVRTLAHAEPADWYRDALLRPHGARHATLEPYDDTAPGPLAVGYCDGPPRRRVLAHYGTLGDGGLVTSAAELLAFEASVWAEPRLARALASALELATLEGHTSSAASDLGADRYALGLCAVASPAGPIVYHTGGGEGYRALYARFVAHDLAVVVLGNRFPTEILDFLAAATVALAPDATNAPPATGAGPRWPALSVDREHAVPLAHSTTRGGTFCNLVAGALAPRANGDWRSSTAFAELVLAAGRGDGTVSGLIGRQALRFEAAHVRAPSRTLRALQGLYVSRSTPGTVTLLEADGQALLVRGDGLHAEQIERLAPVAPGCFANERLALVVDEGASGTRLRLGTPRAFALPFERVEVERRPAAFRRALARAAAGPAVRDAPRRPRRA